jgi:hypothetical protein
MKKIAHLFKMIGSSFLLVIYFFINAHKVFMLVCKSLFLFLPLLMGTAIATYVIYVLGLQFAWCKNIKYAFTNNKQTKKGLIKILAEISMR